jgi:1-pyrroline-5-carboxylate dehydrogenase
MQAALRAFDSWSRTSVEERASLVFRVGDLMRERKFELCAWLVFEVSKNWAEADADIAETIDFCEFYSREALRLAKVDARSSYRRTRPSVLHSVVLARFRRDFPPRSWRA